MTRFKPQVDNVKTGQTTGGFTVINPIFNIKLQLIVNLLILN